MGSSCCTASDTQRGLNKVNTLEKIAAQHVMQSIGGYSDDDAIDRLATPGDEYESHSSDEKVSPDSFPLRHEMNLSGLAQSYRSERKRIFERTLFHIFTQRDPPSASDTCDSIIESKQVERVVTAIRYYGTLDLLNVSDQNDFIRFCQETYRDLLGDYHHILTQLNDDILSLHAVLLNHYEMTPCNMVSCDMVKRHQRNVEETSSIFEKHEDTDNLELSFWIDTFDAIHCYLLHIYDYGYRTTDTMTSQAPAGRAIEEVTNTNCLDLSFMVMKQTISSRCKTLQRNGNIRVMTTHRFNLKGDDTNEPTDFECGLKFYYWDRYKKKKEFVPAKYRDIKEEVLQNTLHKLSQKQYERALHRANMLLQTFMAKSVTAIISQDDDCDFRRDSAIGVHNVLALVLYAEYDELSMALKGTFYRQEPEEDFEVVKNRHSEFQNWSKTLRETVDLFGTITGKSNRYYIASDYVVPSALSVRFRAPISVTNSLEIAARFCRDKDNGIVLELTGDDTKKLRALDLRWISRFGAENEFVFMGGKSRLNIHTVRIIKTGCNLAVYFHALHFFDLMLRGIKISTVEAQTITKHHARFLYGLIQRQTMETNESNTESERPPDTHPSLHVAESTYSLSSSSLNSEKLLKKTTSLDETGKYMKEMFHHFCDDREMLVLDLILVKSYYSKFKKLVMDPNVTNVVRFDFLGLVFAKCTKILLFATTKEEKMDLEAMLKAICLENCEHFEEIHIKCKHVQAGQSWLCNAWTTNLEFQYARKDWDAALTVGKGSKFDDKLVIKRKAGKSEDSRS